MLQWTIVRGWAKIGQPTLYLLHNLYGGFQSKDRREVLRTVRLGCSSKN